MRGFIVILTCIILACLVIQQSGAFVVGSRTVMEGAVKVEKTSWQWHPEKIVPYLSGLYDKGVGYFLKATVPVPGKSKESQKPTYRLVLKNGAIILGNVVREDQKGVLFRSEKGETFFRHEEIRSLEAK